METTTNSDRNPGFFKPLSTVKELATQLSFWKCIHCGRLQLTLAMMNHSDEVECCLCHGQVKAIDMYLANVKEPETCKVKP